MTVGCCVIVPVCVQPQSLASLPYALKVELKWYKLAQDRQAWKQLIATVHT